MNYHVTVSVRMLKRTLRSMQKDRKQQNLLFGGNGDLLSYEDAFAYIENLKEDGFVAVPVCGNHDERGFCKGHEE